MPASTTDPQLLRPRNAKEATVFLADHRDAVLIAGGTALQLAWTDGPPATLIAVDALPEAQGLRMEDGMLRIGAAMQLETLRTNALVQEQAPLLARACGEIGALGVRNIATLGGNIAWRMGDTLPALLVSGAEAELADGRRLPLAGLLKAGSLPLLLAIHWPMQATDFCFFEKLSHRASFSPSRLTIAGMRNADSLRLAASAAGLPARRLLHCETLLQAGTSPASAALSAAALADLDGDAARGRLLARVLQGVLETGAPHAGAPR